MHIFGDPSHIPIVIVERVMNAPRRSTSENSYLRRLDVFTSTGLLTGTGSETVHKPSGTNKPKNGRVLKIVVFVHGFQASDVHLGFLFFGVWSKILFYFLLTISLCKVFKSCSLANLFLLETKCHVLLGFP